MKAESRDGTPVLRVVIDTNVWISAALVPGGVPARLVEKVFMNCQPVFSWATFAELEVRLWRPKFDRHLSMEFRKSILHDLNTAAIWVDVPADVSQQYCRDPDDDKFIQTALVARASWLVTGDQDLLTVPPIPNLRILKPVDALQLMVPRQ